MWDIIFLIIAIILFIIMCVIVFKTGRQFRDRSLEIKQGMSEDQVMEVMEKDPVSIEQLKSGLYEWIYERRDWKGWGMRILKIEVIFNPDHQVVTVERSVSYEKTDVKK